MELKKFTRLSLLLSLAVVLNIIESIVPIFNGFIPGLKLGLANTITLLVIYTYTFKDAIYISTLRVIIIGILRTGLFSTIFFFSIGGAILSTITMYITHKTTKLSIIGVSIIGSIFHSLGQIIIACLILNNTMIYYIPWILLFSIPTGIITGLITKELIKYLDNNDKIYKSIA